MAKPAKLGTGLPHLPLTCQESAQKMEAWAALQQARRWNARPATGPVSASLLVPGGAIPAELVFP